MGATAYSGKRSLTVAALKACLARDRQNVRKEPVGRRKRLPHLMERES